MLMLDVIDACKKDRRLSFSVTMLISTSILGTQKWVGLGLGVTSTGLFGTWQIGNMVIRLPCSAK
jgi:hypothetical protein